MYRFLLYFLIFFFQSLPAYLYRSETEIVKHLRPIEISEHKSGIDLIDCIYVINLDIKPDRWKYAEHVFNKHGIKINRVNAVNGWLLSESTKKEICGPYPVCRGPRAGGLGCLLSHLSALKDSLQRGYNCIWICEDDVEFIRDPKSIPHLLSKLNNIDPNWDIFYTDLTHKTEMGYILPFFVDPRPDQEIFPLSYYQENFLASDDIMRIRARHGTHSMVFSARGIQKVLEYYSHVYFWGAYDIDIHYIPGLRQYCPVLDIAVNRIGSESNTWHQP